MSYEDKILAALKKIAENTGRIADCLGRFNEDCIEVAEDIKTVSNAGFNESGVRYEKICPKCGAILCHTDIYAYLKCPCCGEEFRREIPLK